MNYIVEGKEYVLHYQELKDEYEQLRELPEDQFFKNIERVLHFACIVSFLKESPTYVLLSDEGLIHLIAHYLHNDIGKDDETRAKIRDQFNIWCKLA